MLVFPAFWRPFDWRVPLAIIATVLLCPRALLPGRRQGGRSGFSSGYIAEEGLASGDGILLVAAIQNWLGPVPGLVIAYVVMAGAIMIALGLHYRFDPQRTPRQTVDALAVLLTVGLLLISPNYAWYFLALVPFIPLGAGATAWALTLGALLHYRPVYFGETNDLIWKSLATLPFVLTLGVVLLHIRIVRTQGSRRAAWGASPIVSVVIPCLNEEDAIPDVVREALAQGVDEAGDRGRQRLDRRDRGAVMPLRPAPASQASRAAAMAAPARRASRRCAPTPTSSASSMATAAMSRRSCRRWSGPVARREADFS